MDFLTVKQAKIVRDTMEVARIDIILGLADRAKKLLETDTGDKYYLDDLARLTKLTLSSISDYLDSMKDSEDDEEDDTYTISYESESESESSEHDVGDPLCSRYQGDKKVVDDADDVKDQNSEPKDDNNL